MILALERSSFNYLYKYNQIKINPNSLMELSGESLLTAKDEEVVKQLDRALPVFEEDHELLLLELGKDAVDYNGFLTVRYFGIKKVYPLTARGAQLLEGRLNQNIDVDRPMFEKYISVLKLTRSLENRFLAARSLHSAFSLPAKIKTIDFNAIKESTAAILRGISPERYKFLHALIDYNLTPSYVPEGHLEYLIKIGMVAIKGMGKDESNIALGPFYKVSTRELGRSAGRSLGETYASFWAIRDVEFQERANSVAQEASAEHSNVDMFKVAYYFIAFRKMLQKNGGDLIQIGSDIKVLVRQDQLVASWVLTLLGFSFSFENLYESLHKLDHKDQPQEKIIIPPKRGAEKKAPKVMAVGETYELDTEVNKPNNESTGEVINIPKASPVEEKSSKTAAAGEDTIVVNVHSELRGEQEPIGEVPRASYEVGSSTETRDVNAVSKRRIDYDGIDIDSDELNKTSSLVMIDIGQLIINASIEYPGRKTERFFKEFKKHFSRETSISEIDISLFESKNKKLTDDKLSGFIHNMFKR